MGGEPLGTTLKSGWYAFLVPGIIFYGIFSGRLTPTEAGATAVVVTIIMGFISDAEVVRLPGHAGQLRQGERRDPADHRLLACRWPRRSPSSACRRASLAALTSISEDPYILILMMVLILIAAGCV
jgi:C4-dicarboxylate transporter DctM subunit